MEDCSILLLPEISEMILQHLDAEERQEAVLVSQAFYSTIRHLERKQTLVLYDTKVMDDEIFGSIMSSRRQFEEIDVNIRSSKDEVAAGRTVAIAEKFKRNIKSLVVSNFPMQLQEIFSSLLITLEDVQELTLLKFSYKLFPKKEFRKLRKLSVYGYKHAAKIFMLVADDSLESLTVKSTSKGLPSSSQSRLQTFVNQQRKLKKLDIANGLVINIDHLALEDLSMYMETNSDPTHLKNQTELRRLSCGTIGSVMFEEILKMRNLEFLSVAFFQEVTGELSNLKELDLGGEISLLRQVRLPKLEKLILKRHSLQREDYGALSLDAPNMKHIEIKDSEASLPANDLGPATSQQNQSLEELIIWKPAHHASAEFVVNFSKFCPNLKRIQLIGSPLSESQILEMMRGKPQLTHLWFGATKSFLFRRYSWDRSAHPALLEVIDIFRKSPNFISLTFWGIADHRVEDILSKDADQSIVLKLSTIHFETCLKLTKKSNTRDPFDKFEKRADIYFKNLKKIEAESYE